MSRTVWRTILSTVTRDRSAAVVISPATTARSVVTSVSQATRLLGSTARQWSRMASLIWSATLSGWPMETDSLVNRYRSVLTESPRWEGQDRPADAWADYKRSGRAVAIATRRARVPCREWAGTAAVVGWY